MGSVNTTRLLVGCALGWLAWVAPMGPTLAAESTAVEEIRVVATRQVTSSPVVPVSSSTRIDPSQALAPGMVLSDLLTQAPGVGRNGQGGLLQVVTIRGLARSRIQHRLGDAVLVSDRRAGTAVSFLHPSLLGAVEVVRGAASTYYGSGALGGVVGMAPVRPEGPQLDASWRTNDRAANLYTAWGDARWTVAAALQRSANGADAKGDPLFGQYRQYSGLVARRWTPTARLHSELYIVPSVARDIGKSGADYPEQRLTRYPEQHHIVVHWRLRSQAGWAATAWLHDNGLSTRVRDVVTGTVTSSRNDATDWGASFVRDWRAGRTTGRVGGDLVARSGVRAREHDAMLPIAEAVVLDGGERRWGLFADIARPVGRLDWIAGLRGSHVEQHNKQHNQSPAGAVRRTDSAVTGFVGGTLAVAPTLSVRANVGTGFRFPTLTESFFRGTTPRGTTLGNPELDPETSVQGELALDISFAHVQGELAVYRHVVDNYIERVTIADDVLSFANVSRAKITGLEAVLGGRLGSHVDWTVGAERNRGEDGAGDTIADLAPETWLTEWRLRRGGWQARARYEWRRASRRAAAAEQPLDSAHLLTISVGRQFGAGWRLSLFGSNLLDEAYLSSRDDKSPLALGRQVGVAVSYRPR